MLIISSCGGDSGLDALPAELPDVDANASDSNGANQEGSTSVSGQVGAVTLTADPGQTWVEVEGERVEYLASGSGNYECQVGDDQVTINYQTGGAQDLLIQGGKVEGNWFLNLTFTREGADNVRYSATLPGSGSLGLGDRALSFEGPAQRIEDFDVANATDTDVSLAVNCASPGGDPTAVIGGTEYIVPFAGAQSITCDVSDDLVDVTINRLARDGTQIQIDARYDGEVWLGAISVNTPEGRYISTLTEDGAGLVIDGPAVDYEGSFGSDGSDADGTVSVTCP